MCVFRFSLCSFMVFPFTLWSLKKLGFVMYLFLCSSFLLLLSCRHRRLVCFPCGPSCWHWLQVLVFQVWLLFLHHCSSTIVFSVVVALWRARSQLVRIDRVQFLTWIFPLYFWVMEFYGVFTGRGLKLYQMSAFNSIIQHI